MTESSLTQHIIPSIYIKHVFAEISEYEIIQILEKTYNLGKVDKMFCRPKTSENDGHEYYSCDIHFKSWSNDPNAIEMMNCFREGKKTRLNYSGEKFWRIKLFHSRYHVKTDIQKTPVTNNIYVIYNSGYFLEDSKKYFTTDESKIPAMISELDNRSECTKGKWMYKKIVESVEFYAQLNEKI